MWRIHLLTYWDEQVNPDLLDRVLRPQGQRQSVVDLHDCAAPGVGIGRVGADVHVAVRCLCDAAWQRKLAGPDPGEPLGVLESDGDDVARSAILAVSLNAASTGVAERPRGLRRREPPNGIATTNYRGRPAVPAAPDSRAERSTPADGVHQGVTAQCGRRGRPAPVDHPPHR